MSVAETVRPSVRGAEGLQVTVLLGGSSVATGALAGFLGGLVWMLTGAAPLGTGGVAIVVAAAAGGDLLARQWRAAKPLAANRQVPQAWGRIFGPRLAATLYGARLGVGPLTILTSWAWWAAFVVGASLGPWPSAAIGAVFALTRTILTLVAGRGARTGDAMHRRMMRVVSVESAASWTGVAVLAAIAVVAVVA